MTVKGQTIKATPNYSKRTLTIRTYNDGKLTAKYRSLPFSKEEFQSVPYWTQNDIRQFLKTDSYYEV